MAPTYFVGLCSDVHHLNCHVTSTLFPFVFELLNRRWSFYFTIVTPLDVSKRKTRKFVKRKTFFAVKAICVIPCPPLHPSILQVSFNLPFFSSSYSFMSSLSITYFQWQSLFLIVIWFILFFTSLICLLLELNGPDGRHKCHWTSLCDDSQLVSRKGGSLSTL